jgi:hypothetical protein
MFLAGVALSRTVLLTGFSAQLIRLPLPDVAAIVVYFLFALDWCTDIPRCRSKGRCRCTNGRSSGRALPGDFPVAAVHFLVMRAYKPFRPQQPLRRRTALGKRVLSKFVNS